MSKSFRRDALFTLVLSSVGVGLALPAYAQLPDGFSLYERKAPSQETQYAAAMALSQSGDYVAAAKALSPLASAGYVDAQYQLAVLHFEGKSAAMTDAQAVSLTRQAAELDHFEAQELMTLLVISGFHKWVTHEEANIYHEKLAHKGRAGSQYSVGLRAYNAKNYDKARLWWEKAAAQGYDAAKTSLAELDAKTSVKNEPPESRDFPIYANTKLNNVGDAAASCFLVIEEELKADIKAEKISPDVGRGYRIIMREAELDTIRVTLTNSAANGGLSGKALEEALVKQMMSKALGAAGPSAQYCMDNFHTYMIDSVVANYQAK